MRAIEPAQSGQLKVAGFGIGYEIFGDPRAPAVLLLPAWQIVPSRVWKMQLPTLAHTCRVITCDAPGHGGGERTEDPAAYEYDRTVDQVVGLLDHLGVERAAVIGLSRGCTYGLLLAARCPERVDRLVLIAGNVGASGWPPPDDPGFWTRRATHADWEKYNAHYWRAAYPDFLDFFFGQFFSEPHSSKGLDDGIAWGLETTPEILIQTQSSPSLYPALTSEEFVARVRCPVLIIHGDDDRVASIGDTSRTLAAARPDWEFVTLEGAGHAPTVRDPVRVNLLIAEFLGRSQ